GEGCRGRGGGDGAGEVVDVAVLAGVEDVVVVVVLDRRRVVLHLDRLLVGPTDPVGPLVAVVVGVVGPAVLAVGVLINVVADVDGIGAVVELVVAAADLVRLAVRPAGGERPAGGDAERSDGRPLARWRRRGRGHAFRWAPRCPIRSGRRRVLGRPSNRSADHTAIVGRLGDRSIGSLADLWRRSYAGNVGKIA